MCLFDWISGQVERKVESIRKAEEERVAAEKKWLANPYGMDPELQKRLVAEATKKREDDIAKQLAKLPSFFDPNEDHRRDSIEFQQRKSREEETRKKADQEFEARKRQRAADLRAGRQIKPTPAEPAKIVSYSLPVPGKSSSCLLKDGLPRKPKTGPHPSRILPPKLNSDIINKVLHADAPDVHLTNPTPIPGSLHFLRNDPDFLQMRDAIQQQPVLMPKFMEKIRRGNPGLSLLVFQNTAEFRRLLAEVGPDMKTLPAELRFLEDDPTFIDMRKQIQRKPECLGEAMKTLVENYPFQAAVIACGEGYFIEWLNTGSSVRIDPATLTSDIPVDTEMEIHTHPENNHIAKLGFLRTQFDFLRTRHIYQARPDMLKWLAGKFIADHPELSSIVISNEAEFLHLMDEGFVPPERRFFEPSHANDDPFSNSVTSQNLREATENAKAYTRQVEYPLHARGFYGPAHADEDTVPNSLTSQKLREAAENAKEYTRREAKYPSHVRFTDSTIRRDNTMDNSLTGSDPFLQPPTQTPPRNTDASKNPFSVRKTARWTSVLSGLGPAGRFTPPSTSSVGSKAPEADAPFPSNFVSDKKVTFSSGVDIFATNRMFAQTSNSATEDFQAAVVDFRKNRKKFSHR